MWHYRGSLSAEVVEPVVLFASVIKWIILAAATGVVVGAVVAGFLHLLYYAIHLTQGLRFWWILLPLGGYLSSALIHHVSPAAYGHGTEAVIRAVNRGVGEIPVIVAPVKAVATVMSIACGASAGKEGPSAQIGGAVASGLSDLLRLKPDDHRKMTLCGLSSGFSIVTGAPVAGAVFAAEALVMGQTRYDFLLPSVVASATSLLTAKALGWWHPLRTQINVPAWGVTMLLEAVAVALIAGSLAHVFIYAVEVSERSFHKLRMAAPMKTMVGGMILVALTLIFSRDYLGLGTHFYEAALHGHLIPPFASIIKILFVAVTLGAGFSGGAMTPIFVIGAAAGNAFARIAGIDLAFGTGLGIVAFLAGAANTPLAAAILGLELFGSNFGIYGIIAAIVSYVVVGHRTVNASQLLGSPKSGSIIVDLGCAYEESHSVGLDQTAQHALDAVMGGHVEVRSPDHHSVTVDRRGISLP